MPRVKRGARSVARTGKKSPERKPLKEILEQAYRTKLREAGEAWKTFEPPVQVFLARHPVIVVAAELEAWARPDAQTKAAKRARRFKMLEMLGEVGVPVKEWPVFLKPFSRPGAPVNPETRKLAVAALEAKRTDPNFSWQRFANGHCTCGKPAHGAYCKERIRQAAMELGRLLQDLHVEY
jgi:hypothetical protein